MIRIKDAKTKFFRSKEDYLEFLVAWKMWAQHEDHEKRPKPAHYIIYALLRGYNEMHGFTPITSKKKLDNGRYPYEAFKKARWGIIGAARSSASSLSRKHVDQYLEPFTSLKRETLQPEQIILIGDLLSKYPFSDDVNVTEVEVIHGYRP